MSIAIIWTVDFGLLNASRTPLATLREVTLRVSTSRETSPTQWLLKSGNPFGSSFWGKPRQFLQRGKPPYPLGTLLANGFAVASSRQSRPTHCSPQRTGSPRLDCRRSYLATLRVRQFLYAGKPVHRTGSPLR
ncbi:hypothetical protein [Nostoc sp. 106C]|uniref:hypothetical protein n=1 Tax=Nostoc sp. 106C TaxID=1932667 RepID=UPI00117FFC30|nr:hypothetical protein [Nostoc sp. 106C]